MSKDTGLNPRIRGFDNFPNRVNPLGKAFPVGYYDVDAEGCYQSSYNNLRYLNLPKVDELPLDLNAGIELAKKKNEVLLNNGIYHMQKFIMENYAYLSKILNEKSEQIPPKAVLPIEYIFCQNMVNVMCTPYEYQTDWKLHVTRFKGTHYLRRVETEESLYQRRNKTEIHKRMCSWGYKFEQYCLSESPGIKPNTDEPVDECSQFQCVFYNKLESTGGLLYVSEMDGIRSSKPVKMDHEVLKKLEFVELKTAVQCISDKQKHNYECYRTQIWWCQAYLACTESVIVGWRDDNGLIQSIEEIKLKQLLEQRKMWSPIRCSQFLISFLNRVKMLMSKVDCPYTVYEFKFDAKIL